MRGGYCRLPTLEQSLDRQDLGKCDLMFEEKESAGSANASFTAPFQQYFHYAQLSRKLSNSPVPSKILQKQLKRISDF